MSDDVHGADRDAGATATGFGVRPAGYRLPDASRVGGVSLQIADLDRSLAYYTTVLGFRVLERDREHATLGAMDSHLPLITLHERAGARSAARSGQLGLYHFAILLPDRAALGRFITHIAALDERVGAANHIVSESLYLHDPDGLGIEVYADRPRSTWRARGDELIMDTLALDVDSVVRDAHGEPWTGMPRGTTVGHMHLRVGDLERARAFYSAALGLDTTVWGYPGALFLSAGGYHHHLGLNTWAGAGAVPPGADDARLLEWELVVPDPSDVRDIVRSIEAAGHSGEFVGDEWIGEDPWGTRFRLVPERAH